MKRKRSHRDFPPVNLFEMVRPLVWKKSRHARLCAKCRESFVRKDRVVEDGCFTLHERCKPSG